MSIETAGSVTGISAIIAGLFGTFLGDGHAFIAPNRNSETGRVSWYFGPGEQEIAAKLQRCADAGEIALGASVAEAPGVAAWLAARGLPTRAATLAHEAFGEQPVVVVRQPRPAPVQML